MTDAVACGRKEKIPPPSLSTTTIVRSTPRRREGDERAGVVGEGDVADQQRRRARGLPARPPIAVETTPSMPLAPRLQCTASPVRGAPYHSTSRTGIDDDTTSEPPSGTRSDDRPRHRRARSTSRAARARRRSPLERALRRGASGRATACRRRRSCGPAAHGRAGPDRRRRGGRRSGRDRPTCRANRPGRAPPPIRAATAPSTFDAGGAPTCSTTVGRVVGGEALVAQERVERRHRRRMRRAGARARVGEHWPADRGGQLVDRLLPRAGADVASGDDHASLFIEVAGEGLEIVLGEGSAAHHVAPAGHAAGARRPRAGMRRRELADLPQRAVRGTAG